MLELGVGLETGKRISANQTEQVKKTMVVEGVGVKTRVVEECVQNFRSK